MSTMINYAGNDRRSTQAWLSGKDDGRANAFSIFRNEVLHNTPTISEDEVMSRYRDAIENGWIEKRGRRAVMILAGCAIYAVAVIAYVAQMPSLAA